MACRIDRLLLGMTHLRIMQTGQLLRIEERRFFL
jgi:hypothetical protein